LLTTVNECCNFRQSPPTPAATRTRSSDKWSQIWPRNSRTSSRRSGRWCADRATWRAASRRVAARRIARSHKAPRRVRSRVVRGRTVDSRSMRYTSVHFRQNTYDYHDEFSLTRQCVA
jgi:hypothetical protein